MTEQKLEVIEGMIEDLHVFDAEINFVPDADDNARAGAIVSILQAATGAPGAINSAQAANYSGDPVQAFTMRVSGHDVVGSFWKSTFKNGNLVRVVGFRQESMFNAIAVSDPANRTIWMQPHCERGTMEQKKYILRNSFLFVVGIFIFSGFLFLSPKTEVWFYLLAASLGSILALIVTVGMSWRNLTMFSERMTRVGTVLGIAHPEKINLVKSTKVMVQNGKPEVPMGVYYY